jgi:uncharacterized protein (DUF1810 family)
VSQEDPHELGRFVSAQDQGGTYRAALSELRAGAKRSHWMWFVFPQIAGLGSSPTARRFAIASLQEARAYLDHRVLGPRLRESAATLVEREGSDDPAAVFGSVDALKLRSSMTLFARAAPEEPVFADVLARYYGASADPATEARLGGS